MILGVQTNIQFCGLYGLMPGFIDAGGLLCLFSVLILPDVLVTVYCAEQCYAT